ncbi:MAG: ornithine carbamoyltransferase [Thermoguttaceae bacterium]|nr:ornithine carbamoyltransferase [Planctomycetaceae bacterium]MBQ4144449.1 ornithine carbamoyltransferase [Thermoguttaceae bacterium]
MRHLLTLKDLTTAEIEEILAIGNALKADLKHGVREPLFPNFVMGMIFQKQSLRTRVSFETLMAHLGGSAIYLAGDVDFGKREPIHDFARVMSEMVDLVMIRAKHHEDVTEFAKYASVPVINGLTDYSHPCQALADIMTLRELVGDTKGKKFAWVGDANNVALSLAFICGKLGLKFSMGTPGAYQFSDEILQQIRDNAPDAEFEVTEDPVKAVEGASAVYTDVWVSMGQEDEKAQRERDFAAYQVNAELMKHCPDAYFMHCLPARRGFEVTEEVIDGPQSAIIPEAGNRLHAQKGAVVWLLRQVQAAKAQN